VSLLAVTLAKRRDNKLMVVDVVVVVQCGCYESSTRVTRIFGARWPIMAAGVRDVWSNPSNNVDASNQLASERRWVGSGCV